MKTQTQLITMHYLNHPFLNRSIYPKGWKANMDKRIEQEKPLKEEKSDKEKQLSPLN